jgi:hypothetical protein
VLDFACVRIYFHEAAVNTNSLFTATFYYVFWVSCGHSQLTGQALTNCSSWRAVSQTVIKHKMTSVLSSWKYAVSEFLTWLSTYFQLTCSSPMESNCPCSKKQGPMSVAFH